MSSNKEVKEVKGAELIIYQIGEVKNLLSNIDIRFENYQRDTDKRLLELEKYQAAQIARSQDQPKLDVQKIVLAAFSLVSGALAVFFGINQGK